MTAATGEMTVATSLFCVKFVRQHWLKTTQLQAGNGGKEAMPNADKGGKCKNYTLLWTSFMNGAHNGVGNAKLVYLQFLYNWH